MHISCFNKLKLKFFWLLYFLAASFLTGCSETSDAGYFSHVPTLIVSKTEHKEFINLNIYNEIDYLLELTDNVPQVIDIVNHKHGGYVIFIGSNSSLYYWNKKDLPQQFSSSGRGPDEIESGIRLLTMDDKVYLLQRARISEIICDDNGCTLAVLETFDNFVTYFERRENGDIVWSKHFTSERGHIIKESNNHQQYFGATYFHTSKSLLNDLNFNTLIPLSQNKGYLQKFLMLPYIVLLNYNLEILKVFEIEHFIRTPINKRSSRNETYYEFDHFAESTGSAWFHELHDGKVLLIYAHSFAKPLTTHPMDYEIATKYFDYYTFDPDTQKIEYSGSSDYNIIPLKNGIIIRKDYSLYHYH